MEICGQKLWTVDGSESVLRAWLHGPRTMVEAHTDLFYSSFFSLFFLFTLKLPIMLFSYFVIQFNIKTFEKKNYDLISRLLNILHYMNKLALRAL